MGAPHGDASPPPQRARPAQSARPPHPQGSSAPRGARAARQCSPGPAGARARPMVPGVPALACPCLPLVLLPLKRSRKKKKERERIKLLEAGCWRSPETEQGRARASAEGGGSCLPAGLGEERKRKDLGEMKAI